MIKEKLDEDQGLSEQIDIDAISEVSALRSMISQLEQEKKEQVDEICYLIEHVDSLEEEKRHLHIRVEGLKIMLQKPWNQTPLPRWDKPQR